MDVAARGVIERTRFRLDVRRPQLHRKALVTDRLITVILLATGGNLLIWRLAMVPHIGVAGWMLFGVETVTVSWMVFSSVLLSGRTSAHRVAPAADPSATLEVLIPVAGEPVELVAATIDAANAIEWPVKITVCNDGLMAGKANWRDIEDLCREKGVFCLTRTTGPKGKAGNLNHALRFVEADAILTIDADHQVIPDVGSEMLGWLRHDDVAFVSTPQAFVNSSDDPLNPTEPIFYQATQPARDRHGLAFSTGNGVIYRREALVRIGGFSEWSVVEDLHTSIRLHAAGWKSVYHPRPVTVGLAPRTSAEYARQRARWALDSLRILRFDPPWRRHGLSGWAKLHYSHTLISYLVIMIQVGFLLAPPAWIIGRQSLFTDVGPWSQLIHIGPWVAAIALVMVRWAGLRGALRSIRLNAAFLPTIIFSAACKIFSATSGRGTVTAKADQPRFNRLVLAGLVLPVGLLVTMVWGVFDRRLYGSDIAMAWSAYGAIVSIGPLLRMGYRRFWSSLTQTVVIVTALALAGGSVATARFGWQPPAGLYASFEVDPTLDGAVTEINELGATVITGPAVPAGDEASPTTDGSVDDGGATPLSPPTPVQVGLAPSEGVYVGFTSDGLPYDLTAETERWAERVAEPQIVHWYQQWGSGDSRFRGDWVSEVAASGRVPMISWEAWAKPEGSFQLAEQELGNMQDIADGRYDDYIDSWALAAAEHGGPILLRPFHEMNGFWYPWSVGVNGNTAESYRAGWRHVVDRFELAGADNVSFVWSINTLASFEEGRGVEEAYPGDAYVDWVATSGFNWDDYDPDWSSWVTAEWVFNDTYELLASFDKPVMFAEIGTGTNTGDGAAWVADAMDWFATLPDLRAIIWFDRSYDGGVDFRLGPDQQAEFTRAVAASDGVFGPDLDFVEHAKGPSDAPSDPTAMSSVGDLGTAVGPILSQIELVDSAGVVADEE